MLPRSDKSKRIDPTCPPDLVRLIDTHLAASCSRKPFYRGETLLDLVGRCCPDIFKLASERGFELRFDMPENSHHALCKGRLHYVIRRKPAH